MPANIQPQDELNLQVEFKPFQPGPFSVQATFYVDDGTLVIKEVELGGRAIADEAMNRLESLRGEVEDSDSGQ